MTEPTDDTSDDESEPADEGESLPHDPAVEQLQRSARQMVQAARGALDAIDELIADRARLGEVVTSFTDLLDRAGRAMSSRPSGAESADLTDDQAPAGENADGRADRVTRVRRIPVDE